MTKKEKAGLKFKNIFSFACLFVFVVVIIIDSRDPDTKIENFIYGGLIAGMLQFQPDDIISFFKKK